MGFHLHHRSTLDLVLFTVEDRLREGEAALFAVARDLGVTVERLRTSSDYRRFLLRGADGSLVVDLVRDLSPQLVTEKSVIDGIRLDGPAEILANKFCALLSRGELRDLVDVRALEDAGYSIEDHLEPAMKKDAGLTAGQLAWVLSQIEVGDDAMPPGGLSAADLRAYLEDLVQRLTSLAYPK